MPAFGDLRERLRFERRSEADDGYGNVAGAWDVIIGPLWARLEPQTGSEDVLSDRVSGVQTAEITVRWSRDAADIQPQDRAVDERTGRTWNVISVANNDERHRYLNILASAGAADG
jgi:head-tail adaptor